MPSTNGHGPQRAILYARVSTEEQARTGYSLAQQLEALRQHAACEGYDILEEVTDPGQSGASLARPGLDRVRDLVAAGGVSVVLAQDRDRIAREPAYHYLLSEEFGECGCKIRALNDRGDDTPEGELQTAILDQLAKFERAKTAERTRRGRLRKAREGKIIAYRTPNFGYRYNNTRDGYVLDEEAMKIVHRIFYLIGVERASLKGVKVLFDREGVPTSSGTRFWSTATIREIVGDDVYKPHTFDEIKGLVTPEVAARLDPEKSYGVWWFNRRHNRKTTVSETDHNGQRHYKNCQKIILKPREEWIAVPVSGSGVPREWVDSAREAIKDNRKVSSAGHRFWELSGGVLICGSCGWHMTSRTVNIRDYSYHYYICSRVAAHNKSACLQRSIRADTLEPMVWKLVSGLLKDPEKLRDGLDTLITEERNRLSSDPDKQAKTWLEKLAEADRMRSGYQDLAAKGLMAYEELGEKLQALEETRNIAHKELESLKHHQEKVEQLERDRDTLLESYAGLVPASLDSLTPEERYHVYKMLRLKAVTNLDGGVEINGALRGGIEFLDLETTSKLHYRYSSVTHGSPPFGTYKAHGV